MATQITFTDDVGRIATASNVDGSIRWHMYERPFGTGTAIFVQREVSGVLDPEVRFLNEGERPSIFFDPVSSQWVFTYTLNENVFVVFIDEFTPPATQPAQVNTLINNLRVSGPVPGDDRTAGEEEAQTVLGLSPGASIVKVPKLDSVAIAASGNPGVTLTVRWKAQQSLLTNFNVDAAGFNIYLKGAGGSIVRVNGSLVPFEGFDPKIYEFEVPAVQGTYFVTQVNVNGDEGRLIGPRDVALSDGTEAADVILSVMGRKLGEGVQTEDLVFGIIDATPVFVLRNDTFSSHGPEETLIEPGSLIETIVQLTVVSVNDGTFPLVDTFPSHGPSESFTAIVDIDSQGGVIIG